MQVTSIESTSVTILMKYSRGGFYTDADRCDSTSLYEGNTYEVTGSAGCLISLPTITVEVAAIAQGSAVLRVALPAATDGTDLGSCVDGTCAVLVDGPVSIPLNPQSQLRNLRVESIEADAIVITADYVGNIDYFCPEDDCPFTDLPGEKFRMKLTLGSKLIASGVSVHLAAVNAGTAVLSIKPKQ